MSFNFLQCFFHPVVPTRRRRLTAQSGPTTTVLHPTPGSSCWASSSTSHSLLQVWNNFGFQTYNSSVSKRCRCFKNIDKEAGSWTIFLKPVFCNGASKIFRGEESSSLSPVRDISKIEGCERQTDTKEFFEMIVATSLQRAWKEGQEQKIWAWSTMISPHSLQQHNWVPLCLDFCVGVIKTEISPGPNLSVWHESSVICSELVSRF